MGVVCSWCGGPDNERVFGVRCANGAALFQLGEGVGSSLAVYVACSCMGRQVAGEHSRSDGVDGAEDCHWS